MSDIDNSYDIYINNTIFNKYYFCLAERSELKNLFKCCSFFV